MSRYKDFSDKVYSLLFGASQLSWPPNWQPAVPVRVHQGIVVAVLKMLNRGLAELEGSAIDLDVFAGHNSQPRNSHRDALKLARKAHDLVLLGAMYGCPGDFGVSLPKDVNISDCAERIVKYWPAVVSALKACPTIDSDEFGEWLDYERVKAERAQNSQIADGDVAAERASPCGPQAVIAITVDEANRAAMKLAKKDPGFLAGGVRQWAAAIRKATGKTCSNDTVQRMPLRTETMKNMGRGRTKGKTPKAVAFTSAIEAAIGKDDTEVVDELIAAELDAERQAAIETVQQSRMTPEQQEAALDKLARDEMTPEQAKQLASLFPPKRPGPAKRFRKV